MTASGQEGKRDRATAACVHEWVDQPIRYEQRTVLAQYIVDADGWSFESCPGCGTLVGEWLTEDGPDVMLFVECPMCVEASRDEDWWF